MAKDNNTLALIVLGIAGFGLYRSITKKAVITTAPVTIRPNPTPALATGTTQFNVGGGGGSFVDVNKDTYYNRQPLQYFSGGYDEFDILNLLTQQSSSPTYRQEYPNAPGVIQVPAETQ